MLNITKSGNSVLIESSDNSQFPWVNGSLSVPQNTITYVLEENNDYIVFRDINTNDVLWTAFISEMTIDGTQATRDNIIELFDSIANSSASGEDLVYVNDIQPLGSGLNFGYNNGNNQTLTFNTINGNNIWSLDGDFKDITIEGGSGSSTAGVSSINIGSDLNENFQNTGDVKFYTSMYDGSYDCNINGTSFFGLKPADDTITITEGGGTANGCFRGEIKVNTDAIASGITVTETDPVFTEWLNGTTIPTVQDEVSGTNVNYVYSDGNQDSNNCVLASVSVQSQAKTNSVNINTNVKLWGNTSFSSKDASTIYGASESLAGVMLPEHVVKLNSLYADWTGTQSEYDALGTYDDNITYNIIEG